MKKVLRNVWRGIVGAETGWGDEGNSQWYYFLALVMNCMLTWWLKPELGITFTVASVIHYITVCIWGYRDLSEAFGKKASIVYFAIHLVLFAICIASDCLWTLLTMLIVIIGYFLAPDECGNNFFMSAHFDESHVYMGNENNVGILICHTVWFAIFATIALNLPIALWIRLLIIIACMILHPEIDLVAGDGIDIRYVMEEVLDSFNI